MAAKLAPAKTEQQVTVPGTETQLDLSSLNAHIAAELAAGLSDATSVRERYDITEAQWDVLKRNPVFRSMLKEAIERLRGDLNAGRRITLKSEIALEDSIETLYLMANDAQVPAASRVEAVKTMAQLAGRNMKGESVPGGAGAGGFAINIQIATGGREDRVVSFEGTTPVIEHAPA